ncbi:unnamed protein product [Chrysoparadoxa australica]
MISTPFVRDVPKSFKQSLKSLKGGSSNARAFSSHEDSSSDEDDNGQKNIASARSSGRIMSVASSTYC